LVDIDLLRPAGVYFLKFTHRNAGFTAFFVREVRVDKGVAADHGEWFLELFWRLDADAVSDVWLAGKRGFFGLLLAGVEVVEHLGV
jgi:hypothetical protein